LGGTKHNKTLKTEGGGGAIRNNYLKDDLINQITASIIEVDHTGQVLDTLGITKTIKQLDSK
jgi:hypothetical protein